MPNQPTTLSLYRQLRNYSDNAYDLWKAADHSPSPEYRKAYEELAAFRDSIDPPLFEKLKAAQRWLQINHPYVFFNSTWSNCYGRDNAMRDYLGFSAYHKEPEEGILFKPSARSAPKWMRFAKACGNKALKRLGRNRSKLKQARSRQSENDRVG